MQYDAMGRKMFFLLENSHFLISQEVLELDRAVTVRVAVHTGSAPPVQLKVIDPELGLGAAVRVLHSTHGQ